jgi:hypothetical protein
MTAANKRTNAARLTTASSDPVEEEETAGCDTQFIHQNNASGTKAACRALVVESENGPQRGQFLPDLQAHSPAMGQ